MIQISLTEGSSSICTAKCKNFQKGESIFDITTMGLREISRTILLDYLLAKVPKPQIKQTRKIKYQS